MTKKGRRRPKPGDRPAFTFLDRYHHVILFAILSLALTLRILALLSLKGSVYFDYLLWDERVYHEWALKIMDGTYESLNFFACIIALIYKLFSKDVLYVRILNIILGVLTCYLIYLIGKEIVNGKIGLLSCLIASLYKPFIFYSVVPLNTTLSVLLFALAIYLLILLLNKNSVIKAFLLGMALAPLYNVRPNVIFMIPLIPLFILLNHFNGRDSSRLLITTLLAYILSLSLSMAPFIKINSSADLSQIGMNLYLGNNLKNPDPYYRPVSFASSSPIKQARDFNIEADRRLGKKVSSSEASRYWIHEVIKAAQERPVPFLYKLFLKTLVLLNRFEAGDHYHIGFVSRFAEFFKFPFFSLWIILPFGAAGMVVNIRRSRVLMFLGSILLIYGSTLILFFTNTRYRLPMIVLLILFAVMGVDNLVSYIKARNKKGIAVYLAIFTVIFIIEFLPVRGTDDLTAYYNTHAIILNSKGFEKEAIKYWEESSLMNKQYSAFANIALAGSYIGKKDIERANEYLDKIPDDSFAVSDKYLMKGNIMVMEGKTGDAVAAYEKSLEINSGNSVARQMLIKVLWGIDRQRALQEYDILEDMGLL